MVQRRLDDILKDLTPQQAQAAELMYENDLLPPGKRKSMLDIANELEVTDRTLRNWRKLPAMLEYKAAVTTQLLAENRTRVMAALLKECEAGNASMMKLYMQAEGMLVDKAEIEVKSEKVDESAVAAKLAALQQRFK